MNCKSVLGGCFLLFGFLVSFGASHKDYDSSVIKLSGDTFQEKVLKNERPVMVKFFAPYCGHCRNMIPAYNNLAKNLADLVDVAVLDCTDSSNSHYCSKYGVNGYPTLKFFAMQDKKKVVLDYNDDRSVSAMTSFIKKHMHKYIFKVTERLPKSGQESKWLVNFETFFSKGKSLPKLLLFRSSTNEAPTILFRAISIKYHYKIVIGEVSRTNDPNFADKFSLPKDKVGLVYFSEGTEDGKHVVYDGEVVREKIFAFLDKQLASNISDEL